MKNPGLLFALQETDKPDLEEFCWGDPESSAASTSLSSIGNNWIKVIWITDKYIANYIFGVSQGSFMGPHFYPLY